MFPVIVERKALDDLDKSMSQQRFEEQKRRLLKSRMNVIYIIEGYRGDFENWTFDEAKMLDELSVVDAVNGITIRRTKDAIDTVWTLANMTKSIARDHVRKAAQYGVRIKPPLPFEENIWDADRDRLKAYLMELEPRCKETPQSEDELRRRVLAAVDHIIEQDDSMMLYDHWKVRVKKRRHVTVGEIFKEQLRTIPWLSNAEKVQSMTEKYPTVQCLLDAYELQFNEYCQETMLFHLKYRDTNLGHPGTINGQRKYGSTQSLMIYDFFRSSDYRGSKSERILLDRNKTNPILGRRCAVIGSV